MPPWLFITTFLVCVYEAQSCSPTALRFYASYLASEDCVKAYNKMLLTDEEFNLLVSRFDSVLGGVDDATDEAYSELLGNGPVPISIEVGDELGLVNDIDDNALAPGHRKPGEQVDSGDYMTGVSLVQLRSLQQAIAESWVRWSSGGYEDWEESLDDSVNVGLYYISTSADQNSRCMSLDCRIWRLLLADIHHRVAIGFKEKTWVDFAEFANFIEPLLTVLIREVDVQGGLGTDQVKGFVFLVPVAVVAADVGCWCLGQCIKYYRANQPVPPVTPVVSVPIPIVDPLAPLQRVQMQLFFASANRDLDDLLTDLMLVNSGLSDTLLNAAIANIRTLFMVKLMAISHGVISNSTPGAPIQALVMSGTLSLAQLLSRQFAMSTWMADRREIFNAITQLRAVLIV